MNHRGSGVCKCPCPHVGTPAWGGTSRAPWWDPVGFQAPAAVVSRTGVDSGCAEAAAFGSCPWGCPHGAALPSAPPSSPYIPLLHIYFFHMCLIFFSDVLMQFLSTVTEVLWMLIGNSITFLCALGYLSRLLLGLSCKSSGKNVKEEIVCVFVLGTKPKSHQYTMQGIVLCFPGKLGPGMRKPWGR